MKASESKVKGKAKAKQKARLIISVFGMNERVGGLHGRAQREHDTFRNDLHKATVFVCRKCVEFMMPPLFPYPTRLPFGQTPGSALQHGKRQNELPMAHAP